MHNPLIMTGILTDVPSSSQNINASIELYYGLVFVKSGSSFTTSTMNNLWSNLNSTTVSYNTNAWYNSNMAPDSLYYWKNNSITKISNTSSMEEGNYDVYICIKVKNFGVSFTAPSSNTQYNISIGAEFVKGDDYLMISSIPDVNKTIISGNGMYYIQSGEKYMWFEKDTGFKVQFGDFGIQCTNLGLK